MRRPDPSIQDPRRPPGLSVYRGGALLAGLVVGAAVFVAFLFAGSELPLWVDFLVALAGGVVLAGVVRGLPQPVESSAWSARADLAAAATTPLGGVVAYRSLDRWFERCWSLPCGFWDAAFAVGIPLGVFLGTAALVYWAMQDRSRP